MRTGLLRVLAMRFQQWWHWWPESQATRIRSTGPNGCPQNGQIVSIKSSSQAANEQG
jgi:hypothetical protein